MNGNVFSPHWYRVKDLTPQLQAHVAVQRHDYRGLIWYILDDRLTSRTHRFNAVAYQIIGQFDGGRSLDQIWNQSCDQLGDFALSQDAVIQLLSQLHQADLLQTALTPDLTELFQRGKDRAHSQWRQRLSNPLAIKISLWDPDRFLQRSLPYLRWCFHPVALATVLLTIVLGALLATVHWREIAIYAQHHAQDPFSYIYLILLYPVVKLLHELGHGYSARHYDCEVHEMGVSFLLFMPVPFVDVSSVARLRSKRQRILVGAAGILTELLVATLGLLLWLAAEQGLLKELGFTLLLIGGVSSLLFNGNPLLKYDGYYILADGLGIPNLFQRSRAYLLHLLQRFPLGRVDLYSPATGRGERPWLFVYGLASVGYRLWLIWFIALYLLEINYYLGLALASWMLCSQVLLPLLKGALFVLRSPQLAQQRGRGLLVSGVLTAILVATFAWLPLPSYTTSQGVVWIPEESQLRAGSDGFIGELFVAPEQALAAKEKILLIEDRELVARTAILRSKLKELDSEYQSQWGVDKVKAGNIRAQMTVLAKELAQNLEEIKAMQLTSPHPGRLLLPLGADLPGRFVKKGDVLGYVLTDTPPLVRVVVSQADAGLLHEQTRAVQVRLSSQPAVVYQAALIRTTPEATHKLPSPALARDFGGIVPAAMAADGSLQALEKLFTVDLRLPEAANQARIGQRVFVRFDHGAEPLLKQWYRGLRRTFLRHFYA